MYRWQRDIFAAIKAGKCGIDERLSLAVDRQGRLADVGVRERLARLLPGLAPIVADLALGTDPTRLPA